MMASCTRLVTASFSKRWVMWLFTVAYLAAVAAIARWAFDRRDL